MPQKRTITSTDAVNSIDILWLTPPFACDLSKANAPRQLAEQISELGLSADILINNAGVGTYGRFEEIDPEREQEEIMLNTGALVDLTHRLLPDMLRREDGVIVNVASMAAFMPCAYSTVYGATNRVYMDNLRCHRTLIFFPCD